MSSGILGLSTVRKKQKSKKQKLTRGTGGREIGDAHAVRTQSNKRKYLWTQTHTSIGRKRASFPCKSKVGNFNNLGTIAKKVFWFEIAVEEA